MNRKRQSSAGLDVIIVGAGKVGRTLVEQLSKEGHDITIVDQDPVKIREITNLYDIMGCVGNGASYTTQTEAGINDADLIIAVTESDELNLLCCTYLFYNRLISPYMHRLCNILCINLAAHPKIIRIQMILM